jgi:hypothetical protein
MVGQTGMPGNEGGGGIFRPTGDSLQPHVFDPPLALPAPQPPDEDDGDPSSRKRVLWAFGAAAALFGAGVVGLALPNNPNDGVNVSTDDTAGSTTIPGSRSEEDVRTLVAPVFAPFTFSVTAPANTTTSSTSSTTGVSTTNPVSAAVLAGIVAHGTTSLRINPLPPVVNQPTPTAAPNNPDSGTTSPPTAAPTSPGTTRPPRTTPTTAPPTTLPTTPPTDPPTLPTTPPTDPPTTIPTTPPTDPPTTDTTTTTVVETTIAETTTTAGTTTVFETPTIPETSPTAPPTT